MMNRSFKWIARHQVIAFFIFAFLITWSLGFSYRAVMNERKFLLLPLVFLATCGPALAGIIVTIITGSGQKSGKRRTSWIVFFISWIACALVFLANHIVINKGPVSLMLIGLVLIAVLPVAFIVNLVYTRFPIVRSFQLSLLRPHANIGWILVALLLFPALSLISVVISGLFSQSPFPFSNVPATGFALVGWIVVKFLYQFFFFNGTGEEVGWRGFALPRLQARVSPLVAGLVLALFWVPWHLFLWIGEGNPVSTLSFWISSYVIHIPSGILLCWCYNRSGGSVLVASIAHASANSALALLQPLDQNIFAATLYLFVVAVVLADRMWRHLSDDHPAVHKALGINAGTSDNVSIVV